MSTHDRQGPLVRHEQVHIADDSPWKKVPLIFFAIGIAGLGIGFATMGKDPAKFYSSYLTALMWGLSFGLGGLWFVLVQHAARAGWSIVVRRIAENMMLTLPVMALLVIPVVFMGAHDLYHWTHESALQDEVLQAKAPYLNEGAFRMRAIAYIVVWAGLSLAYWRWSTTQDTAADPKPMAHNMRRFAPISLLLFAFSLTFGAFDWLMSLDPHWFSTIFGVYYFAGSVSIVASTISLTVILLHRSGYLRGVVTTEHFHDLGKLMFAFTVFWGYIGFSQYFLIWYASIPEETYWYSYRGHGDWLTLSLVLVFIRFVIPFLGIMSRTIKRNTKTLAFWCVWIIVAEFVDMYWLVQPMRAHDAGIEHIRPDLYDVTTWVGVAGVFLGVFTWGLQRVALVPLKDPRLEESLNHENF
ncbi:MAG: quinol:cytochrome C oxidoreductase [Deltaproteobacteria bacterium]|nr:quinol:cytochrome C oxidoreductase [Nannocystaceae bacterium]